MTAWQRGLLTGLAAAAALALVVWAVVALVGGNGTPEEAAALTTALPAATTTETTEAAATTTSPTTSTTSSTSTSTTTSTTTTTTTTVPPGPLVLHTEGISDFFFGISAPDAIAALTALLGPPDEDSGWIDSFSPYGTCPGTEVRMLRWRRLQVFLTNGNTPWGAAGGRHFFLYRASEWVDPVSAPDMATLAGIILGSSVADLQAAYGDDLVVRDDFIYGPLWEVEDPVDRWMSGSLTGLTPADLVRSINSGYGCGE